MSHLLYVQGFAQPLKIDDTQLDSIVQRVREEAEGTTVVETTDGRSVCILHSAVTGWEKLE